MLNLLMITLRTDISLVISHSICMQRERQSSVSFCFHLSPTFIVVTVNSRLGEAGISTFPSNGVIKITCSQSLFNIPPLNYVWGDNSDRLSSC